MKKFLIGISMLSMVGSMEVSASMPNQFDFFTMERRIISDTVNEVPHSVPQTETVTPTLTSEQQAATEIRALIQAILHDENLDLSSLILGSTGIKALVDVLKTNYSIAKVNLYGNQIGDVGAIELAEALRNNTSIKVIGLRDNSISENLKKRLERIAQEKNIDIFL